MKNYNLIKKIAALLFLAIFGLIACTQNDRAKNWGGKAEITLPKGQKLINVTWKEANLWYLTRPMTAQDSAVTYTFQEESNFGVMEGTYVIHERK